MLRKTALLFLTLFALAGWITLAPTEAAARYASIVVDAESGQVLHAVNADTRNYPASLTKMMTLYMVFEALERGDLKLDQQLAVSKRASGMPPSKLGLKRGQTIKVEDAILALVTKSANDVAVVVAEALGGKETSFAKMMTKRARALGMSRTSFRNASGLPNRGQKSTARDMVRLAQALMEDFPQYYHYFSVRSFSYRGRTYRSHNRLLKGYKGTDGIKTGYTRASGFNLVSSVERNGRRIIAVVFGGKTARSRDRHMVKLLNRGFTRMASMGVKTIPDVPGRNPFQAPPAPMLIASATPEPLATAPASGAAPQPAAKAPARSTLLSKVKTPVATPAQAPAQTPARSTLPSVEQPQLLRSRPVKPVGPASQIAAVEPMDVQVEPEVVTNDWTVQVGAFSRFKAAHSSAKAALQTAPRALEGAKVAIQRVDSASAGTLYRSQLTGLYEQQARNACEELIAARMNCVVLQPVAQGSN